MNEYFAAHPELMLGEMQLVGRMYGQGEPTLVSNGRALAEPLAEAIALLPRDVFRPETPRVTPPTLAQSFPAPEHIKPNAYALVNDQVAIRDGDSLHVLNGLSDTVAKRIRGLIRVRDAVRRCLRSQLNGTPDEDVVAARDDLNRTYDRFVARFGPVSARANTSAFRGDPDLPLLLSLEQYDEESGRATKAAIFRERTIQRHRPAPQVATPQEALLVTLNERGCVDPDFIAGLLHRPPSEFLPDLKGTIFLNPADPALGDRGRILLRQCPGEAGDGGSRGPGGRAVQGNVEALRQVQPTDLTATEIDARLGSAWIPAEDIQRFAEGTLVESGITVSHAPQLGLWVVRGDYSVRFSVANTTEWGTERRSALELIEDALNLRVPTVYDHDPHEDRDVVNGPATEAARDKQQKLKERFKDWVWEDDERRDRLVRKYNDEFNNARLRTFNGEHLTLPGANPPSCSAPTRRPRVADAPDPQLPARTGRRENQLDVASRAIGHGGAGDLGGRVCGIPIQSAGVGETDRHEGIRTLTPNLSSLLLFAAVTAPMLTVLLLAVRPWRDAVMRATPVAALPALLLALAGPTGAKLNLPWLVQHPVLELDAVGRVFLGFTGVLYLASGWYACGYLVKDANPARFHLFFLLAMAGNFGLIWRATFRPS